MPFLYVNDALAQVGFNPSLRVIGCSIMNRWHRSVAQRRYVACRTRELEAYSDNELAELGLIRCDIPAVAHGIYRRE